MLRHLGLIVVCACTVASVACGDGPVTAPAATPSDPNPSVTVEFGGRVVNADAGGPVEGVRVSLYSWGGPGNGLTVAHATATSGGDGTFTLTLTLPSGWTSVTFQLTAPPGYDDTYQEFDPTHAADRPAIRMYPTLAIRPGESIEVRVDPGIAWCEWGPHRGACRRVSVASSTGDPVELELVPHDSSNAMALSLDPDFDLEPDMGVRRLMVPPGRVPYVLGTGTARLTARR